MAFLPPNFLIAMAASPPVEVTLPAIRAAVVKHTGHMGGASLVIRRSGYALLSACLGLLANAVVHGGPAFVHPCLVLFGNEAQRGVAESDQGSTLYFTEPILHVRDEGERG